MFQPADQRMDAMRTNYGPVMRYQVLGRVAAFADGEELNLGGRQQRLVLALLIRAGGRTVSASRLIDDIWGDDPPPTARKTLQGYVHHLRTQVGDSIITDSGGYSLATNGDVDAVEFEQLRNDAADLVHVDPGQASALLSRALELWTGPAYTDLGNELALVPEITRLEDLRALALGDRVEANLELGCHASLIGELAGLTHEYPLHERFRAQQMTALFRSGRHVEALRAYDRFRRYLEDEMGLDPSAELRHLEARILDGDDALRNVEPSTASPNTVRGYELREVVASGPFGETWRAYQRSVGREVAVRVLNSSVADDPRFITDFLTDTKAIAALEHPNICFVFDTWREPGHAYQVSRWLGGGSLSDALISGPLTTTSTLRMLDEVGGALSHAHREGVVHGRIGPTNLLFDDSGHAYLSDFAVGSARPKSEEQDRIDLAALAHLALSGRAPRDVGGGFEPDFNDHELSRTMGPVFEVAFSGDGYVRPEHFVRALRQAAGIDVGAPMGGSRPLTDVRNPYKGLQAFQETDADDFFGRDDLIEGMLAELDKGRLLAVVGPSGSGKSSTVKAGLLPRLRSRTGGPIRLITEMYPGAYPFEELEDALLRVGVDRSSVLEELVGDERGLTRVLKHILPGDDAELVLVIDQFEELFSMVPTEQTRKLFLDSLVAATSDPRSRLHVVLTMRADFFDRPLGYPEFGALFEAGLVPVKVPSDDELALAISQPARSVGIEFEEGLIGQIVRDVAGQPGSLPLLQYALTELFDDRDSNTITLATYQRGGGVFGALGRRAEALYDELNEAGRHAIRQAFLRMVSVDEGSDDLRRRIRRSQLHGEGVDDAGLAEALQIYGAHRLLTFDLDPVTSGPTVEVAHEALLREWPRLGDWIDEQRDDLVVRKRLDAALIEWKGAGEQGGYLPSDGRLAQFEEWSADTSLSLTLEERAFLEAASEREKESAARSARRRRGALIGLAAVSVLLAGLAGFALVQKGNADDAAAEATQNADRADANAALAEANAERADLEAAEATRVAFGAETSRLAAAASFIAETNTELGLLVAAEANKRADTPETLGALQRAMAGGGSEAIAVEFGSGALEVEWAGERIVALTASGIEIYDAASRESLAFLELPVQVGLLEFDRGSVLQELGVELNPSGDGRQAAFDISHDGRWAAVGLTSGGVELIDLAELTSETITDGSLAGALAFGNSSDVLAVGHEDGRLISWSVPDMAIEVEINVDDGKRARGDFGIDDQGEILFPEYEDFMFGVRAVAFNDDDTMIATSQGPRARVWSARDGTQVGDEAVLRTWNAAWPYVAQNLFFDRDTLVAHALTTLTHIEVGTGAVRAVTRIPDGVPPERLANSTVALEPLGNGHAAAYLNPSRVLVFDMIDESAADTPLELGQTAPSRVLEDIGLSLGEDANEALAISADGQLWLVGTGSDLRLGRIDQSLLSRTIPLEPGLGSSGLSSDGTLVALWDDVNFSQGPLLDISGSEPIRIEPPTGPAEKRLAELGFAASSWTDFDRGGNNYLVQFNDHVLQVYRNHDFEQPLTEVRNITFQFKASPDGTRMAHGKCVISKDFDGPDAGTGPCEWFGFDVIDLETGAVLFSNDEEIWSREFSWSADGARLYRTTGAGEVAVWNTATWEELDFVGGDPSGIDTVQHSPSGTYMAVVRANGSIHLLDPDTGIELNSIAGIDSFAGGSRIDFSADDSLMLATSDQPRLYDTASGEVIGDVFPNENNAPRTQSGEVIQLMTEFEDSVSIWNLDTSTWFDTACDAVGRNMTRAEWDQFGPRDTEYRPTCPQYPIES